MKIIALTLGVFLAGNGVAFSQSYVQDGVAYGVFNCRFLGNANKNDEIFLKDVILGAGFSKMVWIADSGPSFSYDQCDKIGVYNICYGNERTQRLTLNIETGELVREFQLYNPNGNGKYRPKEKWLCAHIKLN